MTGDNGESKGIKKRGMRWTKRDRRFQGPIPEWDKKAMKKGRG